jgi:microcompartment protein CcmK/EutM
MYFGRVVGTVVATIKNEAFYGRKLLLVDRLSLDGQPDGHYDIAVDVVQAGVGDKVLVIDEGNGARQVLQRDPAPVRAVIVGVVDDVHVQEEAQGDVI